MQILTKKTRRHHKRHFQLLELMVAAFILLICIAPVMRTFTNMVLSQQGIVRENQRDHFARLAHAKFTEDLYKRKISLEDMAQSINLKLEDSAFAKMIEERGYDCTGAFTILDKDPQTNPRKYLVSLVITMKDKTMKMEESDQDKSKKDPSETLYDYLIYIGHAETDKDYNPDFDKSSESSQGDSKKKSSHKEDKKNGDVLANKKLKEKRS